MYTRVLSFSNIFEYMYYHKYLLNVDVCNIVLHDTKHVREFHSSCKCKI